MIRQRPNCIEIDIQVVPNARKTEIVGTHGERLKIKVHAPPVDGKANTELCRFFADFFSLPKSAVIVVRGESSKQKTVALSGVNDSAALHILAPYLTKPLTF